MPVAGSQLPVSHRFGGEITGGGIVSHVPVALQTYVVWQRFALFPHAVPGLGAYVTPVAGLQLPTMHGFDVSIVEGGPWTQSPFPSQA